MPLTATPARPTAAGNTHHPKTAMLHHATRPRADAAGTIADREVPVCR